MPHKSLTVIIDKKIYHKYDWQNRGFNDVMTIIIMES